LRPLLLLPLLLTALVVVPSIVQAQSRGEEEARRQLEFAQREIEEGNFEKGLASADSALRLYPSLYEAYVLKALAYEGLGKLKIAESFLLTYRELRPGENPQAEEALNRIQGKLGHGAEASMDPDPPETEEPEGGVPGAARGMTAVDLDGMPELPSGSEEFLSWLVIKQQVDTLETRLGIGGGLTAGGLALAGAGVGLMAAMSVASASNPDDPNVEAVYAAGVGSLLAGGTLTLIGLPTLIINGSRLSKLKKEAVSATLQITGTGFALTF
jgi:hypothetical protein